MPIDQKLLQDIAPYSCAYGHTMSNYVYRYRAAVARDDVLNTDETALVASYYERILRSFLITKHISHSVSLIKNDIKEKLGIDIDKVEVPSLEVNSPEYKQMRELEQVSREQLEEQVKALRTEKKMKSDLEIRAENLKICWPDSPIGAALMQIVKSDTTQCGELELNGTAFHVQLYQTEVRYLDRFYVAFWRRAEDRRYVVSTTSFRLELSEAHSIFPEILKVEWVDAKKK